VKRIRNSYAFVFWIFRKRWWWYLSIR